MRLGLKFLVLAVTGMMAAGCNTWATSEVKLNTTHTDTQQASLPDNTEISTKTADDIFLSIGDLTDRRYKTLGDIEVTVNKTTIFNADPTREMVNEKLKVKAAKLNADAVLLVRYGTVGVGLFSWGSLNGKGRAVSFLE